MATTTKLVELFNADATVAATATNTAFIEAAYENLLGLSGDFSNKDARVAYWVEQMEGGLTRADFASTFLAAAKVQGDLLTDAEFAANEAAIAAVEALDETGLTLDAVKAAAAAASEEVDTSEPTEGGSFTLTEDEATADYSSAAGAVTVTLDGDDDATEGTNFDVTGSAHDDTFIAESFKTITIDGGEGTDTLNLLELSSGASTVNLLTGINKLDGSTTANATLTSIENIVASDEGDTLTGNGEANVITLGEGDDTVSGGEGDDTLIAATEDAVFSAAASTDTLNGGAGTDTLQFVDTEYDFSSLTAAVTLSNLEKLELTNAAGTEVVGNATASRFDLSAFDEINGGGTTDIIELKASTDLSGTALSGIEEVKIGGGFGLTVDASTLGDTAAISGDSTAKDATITLAGDADDVYDLSSVTLTDVHQIIGSAAAGETVVLSQAQIDAMVKAAATAGAASPDADIFGANLDTAATATAGNDALQFSGSDSIDLTAVQAAALAVKQINFGSASTVSVKDLENTAAVKVVGSEGTSDQLVISDNSTATNAQDLTAIDIDGVETLIFDMASGDDVTVDTDAVDGVTTIIGEVDLIASGTVDLTGKTLTGITDLQGAVIVDESVVDSLTTAGEGAAVTMTANAAGTYDFSGVTAADAGITFNGTVGSDTVIADSDTGATTDSTYNLGSGVDTFTGGAGADTVNGQAGQDVLSGGKGDDTINGGLDADTMTGGEGADTFISTVADITTGFDHITDFVGGTDELQITAGANTTNATAVTDLTTVVAATQATIDAAASVAAAAGVAAANDGIATAQYNATLFNYGEKTYLFIDMSAVANDVYDASTDVIVEMTGLTGTLATGDIFVA